MGILDFLFKRNRKEASDHQDEILDDNKESVLKDEEVKKESKDVSSNDMANLSDEEFFAEMARRSENGDAFSMTDLGICYIEGKGIQKDIEKGLYWTKKAAELKDPMGIHNMGAFYRQGEILPQDYELAKQYFLEASGLGLSRSSNDLGSMYQHGDGVEQNFETAAEWYKKAIEQDNPIPLAFKNLAFLYKHGLGVEQDDFESIKLLDKGSQAGSSECESILRQELFDIYITGVLLFYGEESNQEEKNKGFSYIRFSSLFRFLPALRWALANVEDINRTLLVRSILHDLPQLNYIEITKMFLNNCSYYDEKETWKGAERGEPDELCCLALLKLFKSSYNDKDINAIDLLTKSAQAGFTLAIFWLGYCYENGLGTEKNIEYAKAHYYEVVKRQYSESMWSFGMFGPNDEDYGLAESHVRLSRLLLQEEKYNDAKAFLAFNYGKCKEHIQSVYQLAKIHQAEGDYEEANKLLYTCFQHKHDEATLELAKLCLKKNHKKEYEDLCFKAIMLGNIEAVFLWNQND